LSTFQSIPADLLAYLNQGASPSDLEDLLRDRHLLASEESGFADQDLTGDGFYDLAVSVLDPQSQEVLPPGTLLIYVCVVDEYRLSFTTPVEAVYGAPIIHGTADLNGDGVAELVIGRETCGAHTCFQELQVLTWNGQAFENKLQGETEDLPSPKVELREGQGEIAVTAEGIHSVGAGPFRRISRTWVWDAAAGAFVLAEEARLPSDFRIHILHDADRAATRGDYERAIELYQQVITDEGLDDWVDPATERANLSAYAHFRTVHAHLARGDVEAAQSAFQRLQASFPPGSTGDGYAVMGEAFWNEYERSRDLASACEAAQRYAGTHKTQVIEPLTFGYANPTYTPADLCP
jgi:hypothetical protein